MRYPGGKNGGGAYQTVINQIPPHRVYIEPFLGSGAVMRHKRPALINIGLDINPEVVAAFGCASGVVDTSGFNRRQPKIELATVDALEYLASYKFAGDEFLYCDPPYLLSTRSRKQIYLRELSDSDHKRLLELLKSIPAAVAIAGYWSKLYARELRRWRFITYESMTRGGRKATEYLWMNYPEPTALHDYRYLGSDRTERQRIKRKCARWEGKLERMPLLERQALLATIQKLYTASAVGESDCDGQRSRSRLRDPDPQKSNSSASDR